MMKRHDVEFEKYLVRFSGVGQQCLNQTMFRQQLLSGMSCLTAQLRKTYALKYYVVGNFLVMLMD